MNKIALCLCLALSGSFAYNNVEALFQGYAQEEAHSHTFEPLLHGYLHEDDSFCDHGRSGGEPLYYTYNKQTKSFEVLDIDNFKEPQDFTPIKVQKEFDEVQKAFLQSHPQEEYKEVEVTDIAISVSQPHILYVIFYKPKNKE